MGHLHRNALLAQANAVSELVAQGMDAREAKRCVRDGLDHPPAARDLEGKKVVSDQPVAKKRKKKAKKKAARKAA